MSDETTDTEPADEMRTFPSAYVAELREENARHRTRAHEAEARADELAGRLLRAEVHAHAAALADPADLLAFVDRTELLDDEGNPDPTRIEQRAGELSSLKPHLSSVVTVRDVGQGPRGSRETSSATFAELIRTAAR